jgi:hypothetical protein
MIGPGRIWLWLLFLSSICWSIYYLKFAQNKQKLDKPKNKIHYCYISFFLSTSTIGLYVKLCFFIIKCSFYFSSPPFVLITNLQDVEGNLLNLNQYDEEVLTWLKWFECYSQIEKYNCEKKLLTQV